jgi:hypothetical protein
MDAVNPRSGPIKAKTKRALRFGGDVISCVLAPMEGKLQNGNKMGAVISISLALATAK